jgi:hypothetical protein
MKREMQLFDKGGHENTGATLEAVRARADELGINHVVLATTSGETALKAAEAFAGSDIAIVAVTLHAGYWQTYAAPDEEKVAAAEAQGVRFLTATHSLMGGVESAIRDKFGGLGPVELIAHTYYTISHGFKVAVEVAVMAADAGLVPVDREVIAIAGTGRGADTAVVLSPAYSTNFFDLKVREIIAMPR